jgi:hypothetical protein
MQVFGVLGIPAFVRRSRLDWIGHSNRIDIKRKVKLSIYKLERRLQGRPNNRWWNCVRTDTNKCKVKNWKEKSRPEDSTHVLHPHARYMPRLYEPPRFE